MQRFVTFAVLAVFAAFASSCAQSEPQPEAEAAPAAAADQLDATVVDPDHYKVEFENDRVRIVRITYGVGETSVMHSHPDHVAVFLTPLKGEFIMPDGTTEQVDVAAGSHMFVPAGQHHPRNTGTEAFEAVAIEVKSATPAGEAGPDATVVDANHYKVEFENDRVRIVRVTYGPGEESVMHYHPDHAGVFLTDQRLEFRLPDGTTQEITGARGGHIFAPAGQHQPKNIADTPMEGVLVEVK
jgi:quercetin dioxygenase-like cupin family protein